MAFISREFALFFAIVAALYFMLPQRMRWAWLLAASLCFYGATEPVFLALTLGLAAHLFTGWNDVLDGMSSLVGKNQRNFIFGLLGGIVVAADLLQCKLGEVCAILAKRPALARWSSYYAGAMSVLLFGAISTNEHFMYGQF